MAGLVGPIGYPVPPLAAQLQQTLELEQSILDKARARVDGGIAPAPHAPPVEGAEDRAHSLNPNPNSNPSPNLCSGGEGSRTRTWRASKGLTTEAL